MLIVEERWHRAGRVHERAPAPHVERRRVVERHAVQRDGEQVERLRVGRGAELDERVEPAQQRERARGQRVERVLRGRARGVAVRGRGSGRGLGRARRDRRAVVVPARGGGSYE